MNDNFKKAIAQQLLAIRSSIDGLLFLLSETDKCTHQNKLNFTTMGGPEKWKCRDCGFVYEEVEINGS